MLRVGLTGGIGSGKSEVSRRLAALGAVVLDADAAARAVVEPGTPGLKRIAQTFGPGVLRPDGALDRAKLAEIVFADDAARKKLNAIVHPLVHEHMRAVQPQHTRPEGLRDPLQAGGPPLDHRTGGRVRVQHDRAERGEPPRHLALAGSDSAGQPDAQHGSPSAIDTLCRRPGRIGR